MEGGNNNWCIQTGFLCFATRNQYIDIVRNRPHFISVHLVYDFFYYRDCLDSKGTLV